MDLKGKKIGFAMCGSFCTFAKAIDAAQELVDDGADVIPIMSDAAYSADTRFGAAVRWHEELCSRTGHEIIHTIQAAEPIGPKKQLDALVILPCTGNTLAKLANDICDTPVTLAAKAHLRNERPVIIGVSTNDALAAAAHNIGTLLARRHMYFIPFSQDDPENKTRSVVCHFPMLCDTLRAALDGRQLQPILAV